MAVGVPYDLPRAPEAELAPEAEEPGSEEVAEGNLERLLGELMEEELGRPAPLPLEDAHDIPVAQPCSSRKRHSLPA